jgi:hypothetical protein
LSLYQINREKKILRKFNFFKDETIYQYNLSQMPIKGRILKIESEPGNLIYILTEYDNKNFIFQVNEKEFNSFYCADTFEDGASFGKIKDIFSYSTDDSQQIFLSIFQINKEYPLKLIRVTSNIWKEIKLNPGSNTFNEKVVITEIKNWDHPTKNVFKSYGFIVNKVELLKNKTYPVFYVIHNDSQSIYDFKLLREITEKNGYWDYKIVDGKGYIEVFCDRKQNKIIRTVSDKGELDYR